MNRKISFTAIRQVQHSRICHAFVDQPYTIVPHGPHTWPAEPHQVPPKKGLWLRGWSWIGTGKVMVWRLWYQQPRVPRSCGSECPSPSEFSSFRDFQYGSFFFFSVDNCIGNPSNGLNYLVPHKECILVDCCMLMCQHFGSLN